MYSMEATVAANTSTRTQAYRLVVSVLEPAVAATVKKALVEPNKVIFVVLTDASVADEFAWSVQRLGSVERLSTEEQAGRTEQDNALKTKRQAQEEGMPSAKSAQTFAETVLKFHGNGGSSKRWRILRGALHHRRVCFYHYSGICFGYSSVANT